MTVVDRAGLPHVVVVVVTYQSAAVVGDCLRSIAPAFAGVATPTVVVADNASTDATVGEALSADPAAQVHHMGANRGYAAAINGGLAAAEPGPDDAVLVLNPDVRLAPGSIGPLLAALADPGVGIAVPRLVDDEGRTQHSLRREPSVLRAVGEAVLGGTRSGRFERLGEVVTDPAAYEQNGTACWATGAAWAISAPCRNAVGPWDESLFLFSEEVDFALRARDAGFALRYVPSAVAMHPSGSSSTATHLRPLLVRNKVRLYRQRHGAVATAAFTTALAANEATRALVGRPGSRAALRALVSRGNGGAHGTGVPTADQGRAPSPATRVAATGGGGIICFSAQDWWYFNRAHSDFQLLTRAAREQPVLLVNSLGMRMPRPGRTTQPLARLVRKFGSLTKGLRHPLPDVAGFAVFSPVFLPVYRPGRLRDLSNRLVTWQVGRVARRLGITDPSVVVTLPTAWEAARPLPRRVLVANRSDRYSAFGEADGDWVAGLERDLLAHADVAVYASRSLLDAEAHLTANPVFLDHGVDLEQFRLATEIRQAPQLAAIPHPRIGFFGAVDDYTVDMELLGRVAREIPEAQLVLVGPSNCDLGSLLAEPNVHWLGACEPAEVPTYGAGFDVALMPWLDNDWISHCNPIKVKEYLALGLPVVTTGYPDVDRYDGLLRVARSSSEFVSMVRRTLDDGGLVDPERRRAAVAGDGWDRRAAELATLIEQPTEVVVCAAS